jgi:formylglycine-generating enzyme required for sulfatase activity/anti-sigma factor RsiW
MAGQGCLTEVDLRAWLLGELPEPLSRRMAEHLETCPSCEAAARRLDSLADSFLNSLRHGLRFDVKATKRLHSSAQDDSAPVIDASPGESKSSQIFTILNITGYEIQGELGRGGMSIVYQARQLRPERLVALKMLSSGNPASAERRARLLAEADAIARLQHPHIVAIYEVGQHEGVPFLALEYLAGGTLADRLGGRPLPAREAAELVATLGRAVQYAHENGVIHRDLKPANILYDADGRPKISDFGLAKHERPDLTATGDVLGTPSYMAPEQAGGDRTVGPAVDIYALGALLYELLTGRPPFRAATVLETLEQVRTEEPVPPAQLQPGLPRDLETICLKCLHKEPSRRYASAADLSADLERFLAGEPIRARPVGRGERLLKWLRRHPAAALLLGALFLALLGAGVGGLWLREQRQQARAGSLVEALTTAEPAAVPGLLDQLEEYRPWARPLLAQRLDGANRDSRAWLHLRLAVLPEDAGQRDVLADYLLRARPDELLLVRERLAPHGTELVERFWPVVTDFQAGDERRGLAACALAAYAPADARWLAVRTGVVQLLVRQNPLVAVRWAEALRPVQAVLVPALVDVFRESERPETERRLAVSLVADYAADQPALLTDLLLEAETGTFAILFDKILPHREEAVRLLKRQLAEPPFLWPRQAGLAAFGKLLVALFTERPAPIKVKLARRQANTVLALGRLGQLEPLWRRLRLQDDPTLRSYLVNEAAAQQLPLPVLVDRLAEEKDVSARRALLLALGQYDVETLAAGRRSQLLQRLLQQYRDDPDAGIHGALDWLLRQRWGQARALAEVDNALRGQPPGGRQWLVNRQGQTFIFIRGPVTFTLGEAVWEEDYEGDAPAHPLTIPYSFAIASKEVTVAQFGTYSRRRGYLKKFSPTADCPMNSLAWYDTLGYCNWLSEREGIAPDQWCYTPNAKGEWAEGAQTRPNFLSLAGYRLPTEAEWECACRAGTTSSRYYGSPRELSVYYGYSMMNSQNRAWPVGRLKPNDLGLFDTLGNVAEWCQDLHRPYPNAAKFPDLDIREQRGCAFSDMPELLRSGRRAANYPIIDAGNTGLRVVRTVR